MHFLDGDQLIAIINHTAKLCISVFGAVVQANAALAPSPAASQTESLMNVAGAFGNFHQVTEGWQGWTSTSQNPCTGWTAVICKAGAVVGLNISSIPLAGGDALFQYQALACLCTAHKLFQLGSTVSKHFPRCEVDSAIAA